MLLKTILLGDVLEQSKNIKDKSVHCVVTSPPYFQQRNYGVVGQIGIEPTLEEYIDKITIVCREVWRILRDDGTFWLNIGDSYSQKNIKSGKIKSKDVFGVPWKLAFALRDDGWYLRSDIIWHKTSHMPEPVRDRPVNAHEHIFLLTKSSKYFWDFFAVRERAKYEGDCRGNRNDKRRGTECNAMNSMSITTGKNMNNVWSLSTGRCSEAHFATFPEQLVERCIKAGTSEFGCCSECGSFYNRIVEEVKGDVLKSLSVDKESGNLNKGGDTYTQTVEVKTVGFKQICKCKNSLPIPCTVFDPFMGAGTTALVAEKLGRNWIGIELNPEYVDIAKKRIETEMIKFNIKKREEELLKSTCLEDIFK
jgi:DNA modification methylase